MSMIKPCQTHTFMEVHVLLQGVFGGECFGTHGTHKWLFSSVYALVSQQSVFLGEGLPTNLAAKRLLSWGYSRKLAGSVKRQHNVIKVIDKVVSLKKKKIP